MSIIAATSKLSAKIFAHDAGGANSTAAYARLLIDSHGYSVQAFPQGPATEIFREIVPECLGSGDLPVFTKNDLVVTGLSGVHSKFELEMIRLARLAGVRRIISILDRPHNIDLRFTREGVLVGDPYLPDEIWTPEFAEVSKSEKIQSLMVKRENPFWAYVRRTRYLNPPDISDRFVGEHLGKFVLYATDYLVEQDGLTRGYTEFSLLEDFLTAASANAPGLPVVVKLHPAEAAGKYDSLISKFPPLKIHVATERALDQYLYYSRAVFGNLSSVFYESVMLGKPTYSLQVRGLELLRRYPAGAIAVADLASLNSIARSLAGPQ